MDVPCGSTDFLPHVSRRNFHERTSAVQLRSYPLKSEVPEQKSAALRIRGWNAILMRHPVFYKAINVTDEDAAHLIRSLCELACVYHKKNCINYTFPNALVSNKIPRGNHLMQSRDRVPEIIIKFI